MKLQILIPQYKETDEIVKPLLGSKEYRDKTELRFAEYYRKHRALWDNIPLQDKMQISNGVRGRSVNEGMLMKAITIDDWLEKVNSL